MVVSPEESTIRQCEFPFRKFRARYAIEPLENRVLLTLFANGIDSDNLGEGIWAWGLQSSMANLGYKSGSTYNYSGFFNYVHNTQGADYIIIKAADGGSVYDNPAGSQSYTTAVRNAAHAAGLKIFPYFYIRGTNEAEEQTEISVFNNIVNTVGADGVVFDIEGDWDNFTTTKVVNPTERDSRIVEYFNGIGKSQNEDGSGVNDDLFMAYSSFPYVSFHSEDPFLKLGDYSDAAMPQAYWATLGKSPSGTHSPTPGQSLTGTGGPTRMVADVDSEYRMTSLQSPPQHTIFFGHPESVKPVIMTGQMYSASDTAADETEFYNAVINDTNAVGNGQVAGYRYKSVNFFDEDTAGVTTAAQMAALNTLDIGDLPGTPSTPSPSDNAAVRSTTPLLDWADVLNTYGSPTTGAATSYSLYVDGNLQATLTPSTFPATAAPSNFTPSALSQGAHTWQIVANDIEGSTSGPMWHFTVDTVSPTIASHGFQYQQVVPPYVSVTFSEAVSGVDLSDLTFTNQSNPAGAVPSVTSVALLSGNTYKFLLNSATLPDGNFQATVSSSGITDTAGNPVGGTRTFSFSFLRGDANGDGTVNALDFNVLATHFGAAVPGYGFGDFNFDGTVTSQDFAALAANFGKSLPAASQPLALRAVESPNLFGSQSIVKTDDLLASTDPATF